MRARQATFIASLAGIVYFFIVLGWGALNPLSIDWLLHGDTLGQYSGWLFYRASEWSFPLGLNQLWVPTLKATVVQSDSIPLFALLFKTLSSVLPEGFQYFGIWLAICFFLQGFASQKLLALLDFSPRDSALGSLFFIASPPLLWRFDHKSLCAHWLIIWALWIVLDFYKNKNSQRTLIHFTSCLWIALLVHPYFVAMLFPMEWPIFFSILREPLLRNKKSLYVIGLQFFIIPLTAWSVGYFQIKSSAIWGWPLFSVDLLAFINSYGKSVLLPSLRHGGSQHEGFAYLGLGLILFALRAIYYRNRTGQILFSFSIRPFITILVLLSIYALSSHITIGGNTIIKLDFFYDHFHAITGTFRASGRFIWPLYYLAMTAIILSIKKYASPERCTMLLMVALLIQGMDLAPWALGNHLGKNELMKFDNPNFQNLPSTVKGVQIIPPQLIAESFQCGGDVVDGDIYNAALFLAAKNKLEFNSSLAARANTLETTLLCGKTEEKIRTGNPDPNTLYIVHPKTGMAVAFKEKIWPLLNCQDNGRFWFCLPKN